MLGAVGFTPEQLEHELDWIDEHIGDYPYAVDIVIPQKYAGIGETDPAKLEALLESQVPQEHREFAAKLLTDHGVPEAPPEDKLGLLGWTEATAKPLFDQPLSDDRCGSGCLRQHASCWLAGVSVQSSGVAMDGIPGGVGWSVSRAADRIDSYEWPNGANG